MWTFLKVILMLGLHRVWVMRREGEHTRHKRFLERAEPTSEILQKMFVINAPTAVIIALARKTVSHILIFTIILLKAHLGAQSVEAHHPIITAMEKGGVIAVVAQYGRQSIERVGSIVAQCQWE